MTISPIEDLNAAIKTHNPFNKPAIVKDQDVWGKGFPDVSTLNAHASDAVFHAINRVRTSQSSQDKVTSLVITAQQGVGKSHIISRIRHKLELEGGALFVYASVDKYGDLNLIKYQFQQTLADSLEHIGSQRVMQWQEVATAMVNEAEKASKPDAKTLSPEQLVKNFDKVYAKRVAEGKKNLINDLQGKILKTKQNADPYIVRAILWTLSEIQAPFAIRWLSGEELAQFNADELGLPNPSKTNQDREAEALNTIRQILNLVSNCNPVLICFDELDTLKCSDAGFTTPQVIADLVKNLFDTLHQSELSQGVVILTVMMPDTWTQTVKQLGGGIPDRVAAAGKPIDLKHMDGDFIVELVTLWLDEFYKQRNLIPHERVYPFEKSQLLELGKEKPTVRKVLQWCAENFQPYMPPLPEDPVERFDLAFETEIEADLVNYLLDDNSLIADALCFGFQRLKGQTVEGVTIEDVTDEIKPKVRNRGLINFKVIGNERGKVVKIGVAVIQPSKGKALQAGLERLIDYETFDITRGCLIRSKDKKIKRKGESYSLLNKLTSELGGEWVELRAEEIRPLIAIHSVYQKRKSYKLSEEQIFNCISQKQLVFSNPLLQEILSDPSGQIPDGAVEDDTSIYDEFANLSSAEDTADEDDLSDEFNEA
jgi:hypothetical protein